MSLFQKYGMDGVKQLIELHLCPFCVMRLSNIDDRSV